MTNKDIGASLDEETTVNVLGENFVPIRNDCCQQIDVTIMKTRSEILLSALISHMLDAALDHFPCGEHILSTGSCSDWYVSVTLKQDGKRAFCSRFHPLTELPGRSAEEYHPYYTPGDGLTARFSFAPAGFRQAQLLAHSGKSLGLCPPLLQFDCDLVRYSRILNEFETNGHSLSDRDVAAAHAFYENYQPPFEIPPIACYPCLQVNKKHP